MSHRDGERLRDHAGKRDGSWRLIRPQPRTGARCRYAEPAVGWRLRPYRTQGSLRFTPAHRAMRAPPNGGITLALWTKSRRQSRSSPTPRIDKPLRGRRAPHPPPRQHT
jgi:hypothetical protein